MLETIRDKDNKVVAYCEWDLLDLNGRYNDYGSHVFIREIWIHKCRQGLKTVRYFIDTIKPKVPTASWCYWERKKYGQKMVQFRRTQMKESD